MLAIIVRFRPYANLLFMQRITAYLTKAKLRRKSATPAIVFQQPANLLLQLRRPCRAGQRVAVHLGEVRLVTSGTSRLQATSRGHHQRKMKKNTRSLMNGCPAFFTSMKKRVTAAFRSSLQTAAMAASSRSPQNRVYQLGCQALGILETS
eukprot:TRINITY_DN10280_c0_g1_i1.p2 TRINITY_DN10280_c0_g1~~TRINITY_DN10280_c0_g1_i1.p2  ORF type:complete len:150 (+),score=5.34 TRINITY_DN10280_c0_g1_i1:160-609(+)